MDTILAKRPYEITLWTLQGSFLTTLKSYGVENSGQITAPKMRIADDGTQELTFSIPMRYPIVEQGANGTAARYTFVDNPLYENVVNGVLVSNVRIVRVTQNKGESNERTFPFLINKVEESRKGKQLICSVTASGLAFTELGKIGYQIELNQDLLESEFEKYTHRISSGKYYYSDKSCSENQLQLRYPHLIQKNIEENYCFFISEGYDGDSGKFYYVKEEETEPYQVNATADYWLDKVFPNIRDNDGKILEWLTPWSYEIRMNWANHTQQAERSAIKIYEDEYITTWTTNEETGTIQAGGLSALQEKARFVNCEKSNKYNITQDVAEAFGIFCRYQYDYDSSGNIKAIVREGNNIFTGRRVIFYNTFLQEEENPLFINYEHNLNEITRTADTTDLVTKMYVIESESEHMTDGMISIANTEINPTYENYILNFDYLYQTGAIDEYQYSQISSYSAKMRDFNLQLKEKSNQIENLNSSIAEKKVELSVAENNLLASKETLENYQVLATYQPDEAVEKTILQPESLMFIEQSDGSYQCSISQEGVEPTSLRIYESYGIDSEDAEDGQTYKCRNLLYSYGDNKPLIRVIYDTEILANYIVGVNSKAGEGGLFPDSTAPQSRIRYATFRFNPRNKYQAIISEYGEKIPVQEEKVKVLNAEMEQLKSDVETLAAEYSGLLFDKNREIENFNSMMGPALKEGTWQPDEYVDPGQRYSNNEDVRFVWDTEELGGEILNYYYANLADQESKTKTYYPYMELSTEDLSLIRGQEETVEVVLYRDVYQYDVAEADLVAGDYYTSISGIESLYFNLSSGLSKDAVIKYYPVRETNQLVYQISGGAETSIPYTAYPVEGASYSYLSFTDGGAGGIIRGFIGGDLHYGFVQKEGGATPILFFARADITSDFAHVKCIFSEGVSSWRELSTNANQQVWPRYYIDRQNVNINTLSISSGQTSLILYEDYSVLLNKTVPFIELKVTNHNPISNIIAGNYSLVYEVSRANEMLYLDALGVSEDNSKPVVSYSVSVANLPGTPFIEIGILAFINDPELKFHNLQGYVSEITFDLDNPSADEIVIANYKTRFEDLFSSITASSEQMKSRGAYYERAAAAFNLAGNLNADILQSSINSSALSFDFGGSNVTIDNSKGIIVQNTSPYANGVYGVVMIRGGGIFTASEKDDAGNYLWNTAITPLGISAKNLTAGQLDTNKIRIMSGDNMKFQWNATGLYAYRSKENYTPDYDTFVKYNEDGLRLHQDNIDKVEISWDGLILRNNKGDKTFYADPETGNLTISGTIQAADGVIGGWVVEEKGLWNKAAGQQNADGTWVITNPDNYVGLNGIGDYAILAGGQNYTNAKFWVKKDGEMYATNGEIAGNFDVSGNLTVTGYVGTPTFTSGALGTGWRIDGANAYAEFNDLYVRGKLSAVTFEYDKVSSVGGQLYVAPTMISVEDIVLQQSGVQVTIVVNQNSTGKGKWALNDVAKINGIILDGTNGAYELNGATGIVTFVNEEEDVVTFSCNDIIETNEVINKTLVPQSGEDYPESVAGMVLASGASFIYYGSNINGSMTRTGILIDAATAYSPFIDVYDGDTMPKVRLGNLSGITFNEQQLSGYGLFSDNVYLKGAIYATSGQIGGLTINEFKADWNNLNDKVDTLESKMTTYLYSSLGDKIVNGKGEGVIYSRTFGADNVEIDPIKNLTVLKSGSTNPSNPLENDWVIFINVANKTVSAKKFDGTSWITMAEDSGSLSYSWQPIDANGLPVTNYSGSTDPSGRFLYVDADTINQKTQFNLEVTLKGKNPS